MRTGLLLLSLLVAATAASGAQRPPAPRLTWDQPPAAADPFGDRAGPYYHDVHLATSPDGLAFSAGTLLFRRASVPDLVRLPGGRLLAYMVDGARRSRSGLAVAISDDRGRHWRRGSLQVEGGGSAGVDPNALVLPDGRVRLYTVEFGNRPRPGRDIDPTGVNKVVSLISSDGVTFRREPGVRFEHAQITDSDVVKIGSTWFMYVSQGPRNLVATSADGLSFSYVGVVRERGSVSDTVAIGGGRYRQFFCNRGIESAVTADGRDFAADPGTRVQVAGRIVCDPAPVRDGMRWLMLYKTAPITRPPPPP